MIDFNKLIDQHIAREQKPKKIGRYYPSEIGKCIRKTWYSYNHPHVVEPELLKIFEAGNLMHDFVADVLRSEKTPEVELLKVEMPLRFENEQFVVSGRIDDVILLKMEGRLVLVEVKSTKNISFVKRADRAHEMQLQFYMRASGIYNGIILYIDKTNLQTKMFEIKFDEKNGNQIIERFESLHKHLTEKKLPVAEAKQSVDMKWMCRFCEYKERCDEDKK